MKHTLDDQVPVAITLDDGTTAVMSFLTRGSSPTLPVGATWEDGIGKSGIWVRPASDANIFTELTKALPSVNRLGIPQAQPTRYKVVAWEDVPTDRLYRNALTHDGTAFSFDLTKAKEIHLDKIRRARTMKLGELDREWMRATGQDNKAEAAAIEAQRQALREAPQTMNLEAVTTIEELKTVWPADLPRI